MNQITNEGYEIKASSVEGLKDVDRKSRVMVGQFASYKTPDLIGDVCFKGMFDKTWREAKARVKHLYEHDTSKIIGKIQDLWDDNNGAYYKSAVPNHRFGDDILEMAEAGLINEHSFGFFVRKSAKNDHGGRNLYEVLHTEVTCVGGGYAIHGNTPLISVTKAASRLQLLQKFCNSSNVSEETGEILEMEMKSLKRLIGTGAQPGKIKREDFDLIMKALQEATFQIKNFRL